MHPIKGILAASLLLTLAAPGLALAKKSGRAACPTPVKESVDKAYPGATLASCKQENEDGKVQFEVVITRKGAAKLEIDVSPEGKILQTEEKIALDAVPAVVMKAFVARYPDAKITLAEKQTNADGKASYELGFGAEAGARKAHKSATFDETGTFVEEE